MKVIKSIDLWTEQKTNQYECFNGAFIDGFDKDVRPFNEYKIIKNCNCIITTNIKDMHISNKHNAIVFYNNDTPVRLMVINKNSLIDKCVSSALNQYYQDTILRNIYESLNIKKSFIDMGEQSIINCADTTKEIDVGSCDRWKLLYNMLKGYYTETDTSYGNFQSDKYEFVPNLFLKYELMTDSEKFEIEHRSAFINSLKTRLIPIQENSKLVKE